MTHEQYVDGPIYVEDIGEPEPPPPGEPALEEDDLDQAGPPEQAIDRAAVVPYLVPVLQTPFYLAGLLASRRLTGDRRPQAIDLWQVSEPEIRPVAENLALVIPERWLSSRILASSPLAVALIQLGVLAQQRATATATLYAEEEPAANDRATEPRADVPRGARPPEPAAGGDDAGHTSAGLGLETPGVAGPRGRRLRRGAEPAS